MCNITNSRAHSVGEAARKLRKVDLAALASKSIISEVGRGLRILLDRLRCAVHIILLLALTPVTMLYAAYHMILKAAPAKAEGVAGEQRTILVTGGKMSKALHIARCLKKADPANVRIVLVDTHKYWCSGSRFSSAVWKFHTVSDPARADPALYQRDLQALCRKYNVDVFVPVSSPTSSLHDAAFGRRFTQQGGLSLVLSPEMCTKLDDKHAFGEWCRDQRLDTLETHLVGSEFEARELNRQLAADSKKFILKNLEYDPIHRLDLFQLPCEESQLNSYLARIRADGNGISPDRPWQVQELASGDEFCACLLLRNGQLKMLTIAASSPSQLNYEHIAHPAIEQWVGRFAQCFSETENALFCLDFMVHKGVAYPIECNPRVHSQCCVFSSHASQQSLGRAMIFHEDSCDDEVLVPEPGPPLLFFVNEVMRSLPDVVRNTLGLRYDRATMSIVERILAGEQDADADSSDPLPMILRAHFQLPILLLGTLFSTREWKKCDYCIGKVVEVGGD
jgi:hypothetical protein